ncbi:MAG: helix-turn-helix transcriptional regulator [Clostridia bacterium]|nr:helix-turn-helix transcriptional regulator [Clostridia bacterium]
MVDYESMGKRIRYKRRMKKVSQEELAKSINISPSFYGNIERGMRIPSIDTLVDIANFLGTGTDYLLAESVDVAGRVHTRDELRIISRFLRDDVEELDYGIANPDTNETDNLIREE